MRAFEFAKIQFNEANSIINIGTWFGQKYKNIINIASNKLGQGQIQKFVNKHILVFTNFMGLQRTDWQKLTMYVIYRYLTLKMHLNNNDIVSVVNEALRDSESGSKVKELSLEQIQDIDKKLKISDLANGARNSGQKIAEMIITTGAIRQLERHWENEEGIGDEEKLDTRPKRNSDSDFKSDSDQSQQLNGTITKDDIKRIVTLINQPGNAAKQAAINYLQQLAGKSTNNTLTASNGKTYQLSIGLNGDRIWQNVNDSKDEATGNIARELETKVNGIKESIMKLCKVLESASGGSTASGSIASIANPIGTTISRTPNLFGYIPYEKPVKSKKLKKKTKKTP